MPAEPRDHLVEDKKRAVLVAQAPEFMQIAWLRIFGARGHIVFDVNEGSAVIYGADGAVERLPAPTLEERYPDWAPADNLVDIVLGRAGNGSPASLGVLTVEFVDAMYRAGREGRTAVVAEMEDAR